MTSQKKQYKLSLIFDIKRYAINDGPGIRITFFFKGCPLNCIWCHNPESITREVQKLYSKTKCIGAQKCTEICPNNALVLSKDGIITDYSKCNLCGLCAEACPTKAIEMSGRKITADEVIKKIENERLFFEESGGGVTFSGGEPLMHSDFLLPILQELGKRNIHRVIDTCGFANRNILENIAAETDLFLFDLKLLDSDEHLKFTGQRNEIILENLQWLSKNGSEIIIRIPLIKGVNANIESITKMAEFISKLEGDKKKVNLLIYHDIAKMKYEKLGGSYNPENLSTPTEKETREFINIFKRYGIEATEGG